MVNFVVRARDDLNGVMEVMPVVDGTYLGDIAHAFERSRDMDPPDAYGGLIPAFFRFGPLSRHFVAADGAFTGGSGKVPLLGCSCGEWGCWPLLATITVAKDEVAWSEFEQPHRPSRDYSEFGPFLFGRAQYEAALHELERLVEDANNEA